MTEAQRALAAEHRKLPAWFARNRTRSRPWLYEEMADAAMDGFLRACRDNDQARAKFTTFAGVYIRREMQARVKYLGRMRRDPGGPVFTLVESGDMDPSVEGKLLDDSPCFESLISRLGEVERRVIRLRFGDGWTLARIGLELGLTRERIRQIELRSLEVLRGTLDPGATNAPHARSGALSCD